jgi:hypothetical protein
MISLGRQRPCYYKAFVAMAPFIATAFFSRSVKVQKQPWRIINF